MLTLNRIVQRDTLSTVSIERRQFELADSWFDPSLECEFQEQVLALLLKGVLPDWPVVIPPEMRVSRKLAFCYDNHLVVVAGVGLVRRDHDDVLISEPSIAHSSDEGTIVHDSYVLRLDIKRDPLGGLTRKTLSMALRRMAQAREAAGSMAIIPRVLAHGIMTNSRHHEFGFLVYSYPVAADRPLEWQGDSPAFWLGIDNMAKFLAALHRHLFHGDLYRPGQGFANVLWTTDGRAIPLITGWGQHTGLASRELMVQDIMSLILGGAYQFHMQELRDAHRMHIELARRVLMTYGQLQAAFKEREFDMQLEPLRGWEGNLNALAGQGGLIEQFMIERC